MINYPKRGGLEQQEFILSLFWRLKSRCEQGHSPSEDVRGESFASCSFWWLLLSFGLWHPSSSLCLYLLLHVSLCPNLPSFFLKKKRPLIGFKACPKCWMISSSYPWSIISAETLGSSQSHLQVKKCGMRPPGFLRFFRHLYLTQLLHPHPPPGPKCWDTEP